MPDCSVSDPCFVVVEGAGPALGSVVLGLALILGMLVATVLLHIRSGK